MNQEQKDNASECDNAILFKNRSSREILKACEDMKAEVQDLLNSRP